VDTRACDRSFEMQSSMVGRFAFDGFLICVRGLRFMSERKRFLKSIAWVDYGFDGMSIAIRLHTIAS
jgi:hypothetical protein